MMAMKLLVPLAIFLLCIAGDAIQPVYDTEGKELNSDSGYFILPAKHGSGGGLTGNPTRSRCMQHVIQERNESLLGISVQFTPLPPKSSAAELIHLSSDIWIELNDLSSLCAKMLAWHLTDHPPELLSGPYQHVAAGHEDGSWSPGVFRIERHGADMMRYKLVSCANNGPCLDLGLHAYKDKMWLTVSDQPFMVVFKKA